MDKHDKLNSTGRREFLANTTLLAGAAVLSSLPGAGIAKSLTLAKPAGYTPKQIFDIMISETPNAPFARTVDQLRSGSADQEVTGVVTTMFPTIEVINKTIKAGANMIIAHETPFYNNDDATDWLKDDAAFNYKMDLLNKNKIAIWRMHDHWHAHKPVDGIHMGTLIKLGWDKYDLSVPRMVTLPQPMPLKDILVLVKKKLDIPQVRLIGDLNQPCSKIYLALGYMDSRAQIAATKALKPDLILSGETREWENVERIRDGRAIGEKTALMVLSHSVSEEAGMEYAADWLRPKVR
ncbi:MAG: Nif3-like dinuclear metal center hexameric protein, partial [Mucilaginibacter sp.]